MEGRSTAARGGRHADPDPWHFRRSVLSAAGRGVLAIGVVAGLVFALSRPADEPLGPVAFEGTELPAAEPPATEAAPAAPAADPSEPAADEEESDEAAADANTQSPEPEPAPTSEPTDEPEPSTDDADATEQDDAEEEDPTAAVLAAAPDPAQTTVQVLDGVGGDGRRAANAAARLTELGYRVIARNPAGLDYSRTVVQVTAGNEAAGRALQVREPRVGTLDTNRNLSRSVDLHVIVGADWPR